MRNIALSFLIICFVQFSFAQYNYCQAPGVVPSSKTEGLTLENVQVVIRHGDRTPTRFLPEIEQPTVEWTCSLNTLNRASNEVGTNEAQPKRLFRKTYLPNREILPGNCSVGQLTDIGFKQHISLGQQFRSLYVDQYRLLSPSLNLDQLWIRSTDVPRTLASAMGEMTGMFPESAIPNGNLSLIEIHTMDNTVENMYPNPNICPAYQVALQKLTQSPDWVNHLKTIQPLVNKLQRIFNLTTLPAWDAFEDIYWARKCHGFPLPAGINDELFQEIVTVAEWEFTYMYSNRVLAKLGMSSFLDELYTRMEDFVSGKDNIKYRLYSGHDTTVGPLMGLLTLLDGHWPPYVSHVEFELWKNTAGSFFLQTKFNGKIVQFPGCSSEMCPYAQAKKFLSSLIVTNYKQMCQI